MSSFIPYGKQEISEKDLESVVEVLKSDYLTQGPLVPKFERELAEYCGAKYGVAANSATSALHIACLALDVGPGDVVWTSSITFVASANCALYCGAKIDFIDIDPTSNNLSIDSLTRKLKKAKKKGVLPKVIIPVHLAGEPCDMERIYSLSQEYGFQIIEDASHAIGGKYQEGQIGNCRYSDIAVFSFHPVKIITSGEGGMAMTNNDTLMSKMKLFASHGVTRDSKLMEGDSQGPWYYQQTFLGYNYRMTDIHAALGLSQLIKLDEFVERRHVISSRYDSELNNLPLSTPNREPSSYSSLHLYIVRLDLSEIKRTQLEIFNEMRKAEIGVNLHYIPVYHHPFYKKLGFKKGYCVEAEKYYSEAMSLPIYPSLSEEKQDIVVDLLTQIISK